MQFCAHPSAAAAESEQLAAVRSASRSKTGRGNTQKNSSSSSSSSSSGTQASSYAAPALLQLAWVSLLVSERALAGLLQVADTQQQQQQQCEGFLQWLDDCQYYKVVTQQQTLPLPQDKPYVFTGHLAACLFYHWKQVKLLGDQLQQLVLPGKKKVAAAALQSLQEQQQQLQQALRTAVWRLDAAYGFHSKRWRHPQQHLAGSSSSRSSSTDITLVQHCAAEQDAALKELADKQPPETYEPPADDRHKQALEGRQVMLAELAAEFINPQLLPLIRGFGSALWSALPQPCCCNNWACANLGSISEAKLVSAKGRRCSKCQVAR
jgi:hypothetical protein